MRTKHLLLFISALVVGGYTSLEIVNSDVNRKYNPTKEKQINASASEHSQWLQKLRVDRTTQTINSELVNSVRKQVKESLQKKANGPLSWSELGPNNIGGRSRALLIDKDNSNVLYAGGVAGGLFKSETNGQSWSPIATDYINGPVSATCISQASNGNIYVGTGEVFTDIIASHQALPMFEGSGVFVLEAGGTTLSQLTSTDPSNNEAFRGITEIAVNPANAQIIYISTWKGVYKSSDAGATWSHVTDFELPQEYASDVQISTDGVIVTNVAGTTYIKSGSGEFESVSGETDNDIPGGGLRYEYAFAPTDPNYLYAIGADSSGQCLGVYKSINAGADWVKVGVGFSDEFQVFGEDNQGLYSMAIAVDDENKDAIFVAGTNLWKGEKISNQYDIFEWTQKTYSEFDGITITPSSPLYMHSEVHQIIGQPGSDYFFIACDGGIWRYSSGTGAVAMNNNFNVTQFYHLSYGPKGEILGGTAGNGCLYNDFSRPGFQSYSAEIMEFYGDCTETAISQVNPAILLFEQAEAELRRTVDYGGDVRRFWSSEMENEYNYVTAQGVFTDNDLAIYAPFDLWETNNFEYGADEQKFPTQVPIANGQNLVLGSFNIEGGPIYWEATQNYAIDDTVYFMDPYKSMFVIGIQDQLWLTRISTNFKTYLNDPVWNWIDIFNLSKLDVANGSNVIRKGHITATEFSHDANQVYFAIDVEDASTETPYYDIYRIDSLHERFTDKYHAWGYYDHEDFRTSIHRIGTVENQVVTSLTIDENNPDVLIVTLGNYVDSDHVYIADNAATTNDSVFANNFRSLQGDLPQMPVFDAVVNVMENNQVIIGTEYGVWTTDDYTSSSPQWVFSSDGLGAVPVMSVEQQIYTDWNFPEVENYGNIYIGTHGRGAFVDSTYWHNSGINDNFNGSQNTANSNIDVNIYPNPVVANANIDFTVDTKTSINIQVAGIDGRIYMNRDMGNYNPGSYNYSIDMSNYSTGVYYVVLYTSTGKETVKIVKE